MSLAVMLGENQLAEIPGVIAVDWLLRAHSPLWTSWCPLPRARASDGKPSDRSTAI